MAYVSDYTADDTTSAVGDGLVRFVLAVGPYAALIVIVGLAIWGVNAYRKNR